LGAFDLCTPAWGARAAVVVGRPNDAWARALGRAAVMLGVLTSIGGVLYLLANT
jgi:hypothetical protein